jgi:hypothetical protein
MIKEQIQTLMQLPDEVFGLYLFNQDPLRGKLSPKQKEVIFQDAMQCGIDLSQELKEKYGHCTVDEFINKLDIKLTYKDSHNGLEYIYFGTYQKPNKMTIYKENIKKGHDLAVQEHILELQEVNLEDIVKAHELFHHFEEQRKELYVNTHKITLWRFGKYEHKSKLVSQSEIASMAFAKDLLQLDFSPNVLDVLLLHPHNKNQAQKVYDIIMNYQLYSEEKLYEITDGS